MIATFVKEEIELKYCQYEGESRDSPKTQDARDEEVEKRASEKVEERAMRGRECAR